MSLILPCVDMPDKIGRASLSSKETTHGLYFKAKQT